MVRIHRSAFHRLFDQRYGLHPVGRFWNRGQRRFLQSRRKAIELLKAHDEGTPLVWIDAVWRTRHQQRSIGMHANNLDLKGDKLAANCDIVFPYLMRTSESRLQLDWTFQRAGRR